MKALSLLDSEYVYGSRRADSNVGAVAYDLPDLASVKLAEVCGAIIPGFQPEELAGTREAASRRRSPLLATYRRFLGELRQ